MKKIAIGLIVFLALISTVPALAAKAAAKWYIAENLENKSGAFGGLRYQKVVDEDAKVVCYTAIGVKQDVSISCVKR